MSQHSETLEAVTGIWGAQTTVPGITTKRVEGYALGRSAAVRDTTVNKDLSTIRTMFDKAVDQRFIDRYSARSVKELPDESTIHDPHFKQSEFETLLTTVLAQCESGLPPSDLAFPDFPEFVSLEVRTGLRLSEMLMLRFHHIDFDNEILRNTWI